MERAAQSMMMKSSTCRAQIKSSSSRLRANRPLYLATIGTGSERLIVELRYLELGDHCRGEVGTGGRGLLSASSIMSSIAEAVSPRHCRRDGADGMRAPRTWARATSVMGAC